MLLAECWPKGSFWEYRPGRTHLRVYLKLKLALEMEMGLLWNQLSLLFKTAAMTVEVESPHRIEKKRCRIQILGTEGWNEHRQEQTFS